MANFDRVLRQIGEFGKAQILLYIFICLCGIPTGEQNLSSVFTGASQDHWCRVEGLEANSPDERRRFGVPRDSQGGGHLSCVRYDFDFRNFTHSLNSTEWETARANLSTVKCHSWEFDTSEIQSTIGSQYELVCDNAFLVKMVTSVYMAGKLTGCSIGGMAADKFGRIKTVVIAAMVQVVVGMVAALVPNLIVHIIARFFVAFTAATVFTTAFVIAMEVIGPRFRVHTGILVQAWFAIGFIMLAGLAYFIRSHLILQVVVAAQPVIFCVYWWLYPESPRWLVSQGRFEEADEICRQIARLNGRQLPAEFTVAKEAFTEDADEKVQESKTANGKAEHQAVGQQQAGSIVDLVRRPRMRKRSLIVFYCWFATSIAYYGLSLNAEELGGSIYLNTAISGLVELPAYAMCCLLLNRFGRVKMLVATFALGGIGCIATGFISILWLRVSLAMVGKFAISASFAIIYVYSAEVFPTVIRNVGVGVSSTHARIGALLAPQIVLLSSLWPPLPFSLIGCLSLLAALLSLLLPETLNQPLPETVEDGENFGTKLVAPMQCELSSS